jgi:hypothetical protein
MNDRKLGPAELVIAISGAVVLVASFLDVYEDRNAWGEFLFPLLTLPAVVGLIMAAHVLLTAFGGVQLPARVLGLDASRLHLVLGAYATAVMVCFLISDSGFQGSSPDRSAGFWLMLLASIGLLVGAVMMRNTDGGGAGTGTIDGV